MVHGVDIWQRSLILCVGNCRIQQDSYRAAGLVPQPEHMEFPLHIWCQREGNDPYPVGGCSCGLSLPVVIFEVLAKALDERHGSCPVALVECLPGGISRLGKG